MNDGKAWDLGESVRLPPEGKIFGKPVDLLCVVCGGENPYPITERKRDGRWICKTCYDKEKNMQSEIPIAEQTAIASDCIHECTAYLAELKAAYIAIAATEEKLTTQVCGDLNVVAGAIETLTESVAKIIDRLHVGKPQA